MGKNFIHGGNVEKTARVLGLKKIPAIEFDFSVNVNPLGPPPDLEAALIGTIKDIVKYPEPFAETAGKALAENMKIDPQTIVLGNGSTEIIGNILYALKPSSPGWLAPCYKGYEEACLSADMKGHSVLCKTRNGKFIPYMKEIARDDSDLLFICNPNNPTGGLLKKEFILKLASKIKTIVVDESFMDFVEDSAKYRLFGAKIPSNVIILKSLTKFFAIPGLRLGMAYGAPEIIEKIKQKSLPWSVNALAQYIVPFLYKDKKYIENTIRFVQEQRRFFAQQLQKIKGIYVYPSTVNFLLIKLLSTFTAKEVQKKMLEKSILIRTCDDFEGLGNNHCRLAVRPKKETERFIEIFTCLFCQQPKKAIPKKHAKAIMVVGTMSNSGKSVIAAGLCRYFARLGYKVAPYKAQNMSLNSFVTEEGGEMGRAQVVQAIAAGVKPHTDMNPVLLKPLGEAGSQVIVNGKPIGVYKAGKYYQEKEIFKREAQKAFGRLAASYDIIVMEGAGSPAEINLRDGDFVNLAMAEYANAKAILVADIDRGGVFASIAGTLALLPHNQRRLVKGIIINKFRGDVKLLEPGLKQVEAITGTPVLGVIPYIRDLNIDAEDSLCLDEKQKSKSNFVIDILIIRLPHISNFTDFRPLESSLSTRVRYETEVKKAGSPDLIILPGTRNTCGDLDFLHKSGWTNFLRKHAGKIPIIGICGGYQMLGSYVSDPYSVEGKIPKMHGINLLPVATTLQKEKKTVQIEGFILPNIIYDKKTFFRGYEIHAGITCYLKKTKPMLEITRSGGKKVAARDGAVSQDSMVMGCYAHGIFDEESVRQNLFSWLCKRKNITLNALVSSSSQAKQLKSIDLLANLLDSRINLDIFL